VGSVLALVGPAVPMVLLVFPELSKVWILYGYIILYIILYVSAVALILRGSYCWAKYKGRSGWWALLGLVAPIGFIGLAVLKDKEKEEMSVGLSNLDFRT